MSSWSKISYENVVIDMVVKNTFIITIILDVLLSREWKVPSLARRTGTSSLKEWCI